MSERTLLEIQRWLTATGWPDEFSVRGDRLIGPAGEEYDPHDVVAAATFEVAAEPDGSTTRHGPSLTLVALDSLSGEHLGTLVASEPGTGAVLSALRPAPLPAAERRADRERVHVAAVFPTHQQAESAVAELRRLGLGSEHLGLAVRQPDTVVFEHDAEAELERDTEVGAAAGMPIGALAGMALGLIAVPGLGVLGIAGLLAVGAATSLGGAMLGGYLGVAAAARALTEHDQLSQTPLEEGEVLVVVTTHGHPHEVRAALDRSGGRLLPTPPAHR